MAGNGLWWRGFRVLISCYPSCAIPFFSLGTMIVECMHKRLYKYTSVLCRCCYVANETLACLFCTIGFSDF